MYFLPQPIIFFSVWPKPKNLHCPVGTNQEHRYSLSWRLGGSSCLCQDTFLAHCLPPPGSLCSRRRWNKALQWQRQTSSSKTLVLSCDYFSWHSFRLTSSGHFCTENFVINSRQLGTFCGKEDLALPLCSFNFHTGAIWCDSAMAGVVPLPLDLLHDHFCNCRAWDTRAESVAWESLEPETSWGLLADLCLKYLWAKKVLGPLRSALSPICFFM